MRSASTPDEYCIDAKCLTDALEEDLFGPPNKKRNQEREETENLRRVACHEAGHACLSCILGKIPSFATIVGRGHYGGYVMPDPDQNTGDLTRQELLNHIMISLGGRAAEQIYYGKENGTTAGASSDLQTATNTALNMILNYGMEEEEGMGSFPTKVISEQTKKCVNRILEEQLTRAKNLLTDAKPKLDKLVQALLDKNLLSSAEIADIMNS